MENKKRRCWTGMTDEDMMAEDPELARQIQERREKILRELEIKDIENGSNN
jgi:hypothetical protein